jgi:protein gp37
VHDRLVYETPNGWKPKPTGETWVREIRDQCVGARVALFFKQWGGPTPKSGGRTLDSRTWDEVPNTDALGVPVTELLE